MIHKEIMGQLDYNISQFVTLVQTNYSTTHLDYLDAVFDDIQQAIKKYQFYIELEHSEFETLRKEEAIQDHRIAPFHHF